MSVGSGGFWIVYLRSMRTRLRKHVALWPDPDPRIFDKLRLYVWSQSRLFLRHRGRRAHPRAVGCPVLGETTIQES